MKKSEVSRTVAICHVFMALLEPLVASTDNNDDVLNLVTNTSDDSDVSEASTSSSNSVEAYSINPEFSLGHSLIKLYLIPIVTVLGLVGNVVSLTVVARDDSVKPSAGLMLEMLAVADIVYLTMNLPMSILSALAVGQVMVQSEQFSGFSYVRVYVLPFISAAQMASGFMVVVIYADRYATVFSPKMAAHLGNLWRVRLIVVCVWLISILYNLPRFFEQNIVDSGGSVVLVDSLNVNYVYWLVYRTIAFFIVRLVLPLGFLSFFTHHLAASLRLTAKRRQMTASVLLVEDVLTVSAGGNAADPPKPETTKSAAPLDANERRIMVKLFAVIVLYVVAYLPVVYTGTVGVAGQFFDVGVLRSWSEDLSDLILVANSSANVLIYYSMRQRMRRACCRLKVSGSVELNKISRSITAIEPTVHAATASTVGRGNDVRYMDIL